MSSHNYSPSIKYSPIQVTLEYFRKAFTTPSITQSPTPSSPSLTFTENNISVACCFVFVSQSIRQRFYSKLIEEMVEEIDFEKVALTNQPDSYKEFMAQQTVIAVLGSGLMRVEKAAREHQYELKQIHKQMVGLCNCYPFFRFCLGVWARCKALSYLSKHPQMRYQLSGNEPQLLCNLSCQPRNTPLDILCHALDIHLTLSTQRAKEQYGRHGSYSSTLKLINKQINYVGWEDKEAHQPKGSEVSFNRKSGNVSTSNTSNTSKQQFSASSGKSKDDLILCECLGHCRCSNKKKVGFLSPKYSPNEEYGFTSEQNTNYKLAKWHTSQQQ